ncbi:hypothetical protein Tco_0961183 [Tanacetum coccineum]
MEDEFYNLVVKGNDLKTYIRRFQELAVLCPNMVPNAEKLMEVFINGLPRSIEGNVTASKPQTLEEAINIAQRTESKKPSGLMLPPMGILGIIPCVKNAPCITLDPALSSVRHATKKGIMRISAQKQIMDIIQIGAQKQTTGLQEGVLRDKFDFVHSRISTLETTLEDIQVHHQNFLKHTS